MPLGNIKVDRTAVISRVEAVVTESEKALADATKNLSKYEAECVKANAALVKVATKNTIGDADLGHTYWHGQGRVCTVTYQVDAENADVVAAQAAVVEAQEKVSDAAQAVRSLPQAIKNAKRDLNLLNASSETTINVKTAGFLGYFE